MQIGSVALDLNGWELGSALKYMMLFLGGGNCGSSPQ